MTRKILACITLILAFCLVTACGAKEAAPADETAPAEKVSVPAEDAASDGVAVDYGVSNLYTKEDMDVVIALIKDRFAEMTGCELHSLTYYGDECNSKENVEWLNELEYGKGVGQAMAFKSDYRSPSAEEAEGTAWEPDTEYTDWEWWFGRNESGEWVYVTSGY